MGAASAAPFLLSFTLKRPCSTKKGKMFVILSAAKDLLFALMKTQGPFGFAQGRLFDCAG